jgi:hypothetical protein
MGEYDVTLKHIIRIGGRGFLGAMGFDGRVTPIQTDFPNTRNRQVDFLAVLEPPDGSRKLLHIEFQSAPDSSMAARMLGYCADILVWLAEQRQARQGQLPAELLQKVVYVGQRPWTPETTIQNANLSFRFKVVNAVTLPWRPLLEAGDLGDAVVAILCADGTSPNVIKAILTKIAQAPENERADALAQLVALSGLRGVRPQIEQEYKAMGITVNVEDSELLRAPIDRARTEGKAQGKAEGKAEAIETILQRRFPQDVPAGLTDHLVGLALPTLDVIFERSLTAKSVEDALGSYMPSKTRDLNG